MRVHARTGPRVGSGGVGADTQARQERLAGGHTDALFGQQSQRRRLVAHRNPQIQPVTGMHVQTLTQQQRVHRLLPSGVDMPGVGHRVERLFVGQHFIQNLLQEPAHPSRSQASLGDNRLHGILRPRQRSQAQIRPVRLRKTADMHHVLRQSLRQRCRIRIGHIATVIVFHNQRHTNAIRVVREQHVRQSVDALRAEAGPGRVLGARLQQDHTDLMAAVRHRQTLRFQHGQRTVECVGQHTEPVHRHAERHRAMCLDHVENQRIFRCLGNHKITRLNKSVHGVRQTVARAGCHSHRLRLIRPVASQNLFQHGQDGRPVV